MADTKKRKPKRRAYLDDYKPDASGRYQYTGAVHTCTTPLDKRRYYVRWLWICSLTAAVAVVADGCIPAPAMMTAFGLLPYIGQVSAVGSVVWAMCRLRTSFDRIYAYVFDATIAAFPVRSMAAVILGAISAVGIVLHGFVYATWTAWWWTLLSIGLKLLSIVAMLHFRRIVSALSYQKNKPN